MLSGRYRGVVLLGLRETESRLLLPYLGWSMLMFGKFGKGVKLRRGGPGAPEVTLQQRTNNKTIQTVSEIEACLRAYVSGAGWSPLDSIVYKNHTTTDPHFRVWGRTTSSGEPIAILGFSEEFLHHLDRCGGLFTPTSITSLCQTLDRRMPDRTLFGPPTPEGVRALIDFFARLLPDYPWAENSLWLESEGADLITALEIGKDIQNTIDRATYWVSILAKDRHLSNEFVTKHLGIRSICG